jgi:capsular exopolysaccharide synthesis family protein
VLALNEKTLSVSRMKSLIAHTSPFSKVAEQYKSARTNLYFLMKNSGKKILLVTSTHKGEGKTTSVINLAISMAKGDERVLVIDANFRNPSIHSVFNRPNQTGFLDVLKETVVFEDVVYSTYINDLDVLMCGDISASSLEVINSNRIAAFLEEISDKYDRIVIDAPPVLEAAEARFLASRCDGVIMITNRYVTKMEEFATAKRALEVANANVVGVVLNEKK